MYLMRRFFGMLLACGFLSVAMLSAEPVTTHPKPSHKAAHAKVKKVKKPKTPKTPKAPKVRKVARKVSPKKVAG